MIRPLAREAPHSSHPAELPAAAERRDPLASRNLRRGKTVQKNTYRNADRARDVTAASAGDGARGDRGPPRTSITPRRRRGAPLAAPGLPRRPPEPLCLRSRSASPSGAVTPRRPRSAPPSPAPPAGGARGRRTGGGGGGGARRRRAPGRPRPPSSPTSARVYL